VINRALAAAADVNAGAGRAESGLVTPIFDREVERQALEQLVSEAPSSITVVLGPKGSGKTTLLSNFSREHELDGICYIDCRGFRASNPTDFARALVTQGLPASITDLSESSSFWQSVRTSLSGVELTVPNVGQLKFAESVAAYRSEAQPVDINRAIDMYERLLSAWAKARVRDGKRRLPRAVIVLDEANKLMNWSSEHKLDLDALLAYFTKITKQDKTAHVMLVTSEYAFQGWLTAGECDCVCFNSHHSSRWCHFLT
jgi:AAA+ ATPase superfamily predicted ATPase